jgi:hypothetical protein
MALYNIANSIIQATGIAPFNSTNPQNANPQVSNTNEGSFVATTQTGGPSNIVSAGSIGGSGIGSAGVLITNPA